jgi:hypothetical protein
MALPSPFVGIKVRLGNSSTFSGVGGSVNHNVTTVEDNTGGGTEVDLMSYTVPANALNANGDYIHLVFCGEKFGALSTEFKLYIGGSSYSFFSGTTVGWWMFHLYIIRTASNAVRAVYWGLLPNNTPFSTYVSQGVTLSSTFVVKITSKTTGTGPTSYSRQYVALCDFLPVQP